MYRHARQALLDRSTKPCPKCGIAIEKNNGCQHMTCRTSSGGDGCGYEWCWQCLGPYHTSSGCVKKPAPPAGGTAGAFATDNRMCREQLQQSAAARTAAQSAERRVHAARAPTIAARAAAVNATATSAAAAAAWRKLAECRVALASATVARYYSPSEPLSYLQAEFDARVDGAQRRMGVVGKEIGAALAKGKAGKHELIGSQGFGWVCASCQRHGPGGAVGDMRCQRCDLCQTCCETKPNCLVADESGAAAVVAAAAAQKKLDEALADEQTDAGWELPPARAAALLDCELRRFLDACRRQDPIIGLEATGGIPDDDSDLPHTDQHGPRFR